MSNSNNALDTSVSYNLLDNQGSANSLDLNNALQLSSSSTPPQQALPAGQSILEKNKGWWTVPDFNGDKNRDIFWRNNETGKNKAWLFSGVDGEFTEISLADRGKDWDFKIADFNGDGKSDFFWRNSTTGENQVWIANVSGNTFNETFTITDIISTEKSWYVDIGDFNGDSKNDLIWRNYQTGQNAIWLMDGSSSDRGFIYTVDDKNWDLKVGYANDDNRTDLYWYQRDTGEVAIWLMNGNNSGDGFNSGDNKVIYTLQDKNWRFELGETNGDGKNDLIWRNYQTGENAIWLIDGAKFTNTAFIYKLDDLNWDYDLADTNGDGKTDLIWRNYKTGENAIWFVDGVTFELKNSWFLKPLKETTWDFSITDTNGDGKTDLVWRNYETGDNKLWLGGDKLWLKNGSEVDEFNLNKLEKGWIFN
jgi:hypothetical protein